MSIRERIVTDFDGTLVEHLHPGIGKPAPHAIEVLKEIKDAGHELGLWTCRSGIYLAQALTYLKENGIVMDLVNECPVSPYGSQWSVDGGDTVTVGHKLFYSYSIDDRDLFCPKIKSPHSDLLVVDWLAVRTQLQMCGLLPKKNKKRR